MERVPKLLKIANRVMEYEFKFRSRKSRQFVLDLPGLDRL